MLADDKRGEEARLKVRINSVKRSSWDTMHVLQSIYHQNLLNTCHFHPCFCTRFMVIFSISQENSVISSLELENTETTIEEEPTTEAMTTEVEEISKCYPKTLSICSHLPYNTTTYPNLVGHTSKDAILRDLVAFRELLDAECSHLAQVKNHRSFQVLFHFKGVY